MSEAVEYRLAVIRRSQLMAHGIAYTFLSLFPVGYGTFTGTWAGLAVAVYGLMLYCLGALLILQQVGKRSDNVIRRFIDPLPYVGDYDERPFDEWHDELEARGAFHGDRK